ncbi:15322_t:CDS:2, partial [Cetraspora pellucida]
KSEKAVSAQTERLHQQEHTKRVHSINTKQEEIREPILSTNTELLDDIELENSDKEEISLSSKNTEIFYFQQVFTLLYKAITALLIFIKALVFEDDLNFSKTLYKAKNAMSFKKPTIQFAICEKCHYLTNIESISDNSQQTNCNESRRMYYSAIILVSCNTPARNKICGFSSHSSKHACFKYKKKFKANNTSDQSNIDNYSVQIIEEHRTLAEKWKYSVSSNCKQLFDQYNIQ